MIKWMFVSEPKKVDTMTSTVQKINDTFKAFLSRGSWAVYAVAMLLVVVSIYFFFADQNRRKTLLQRRREIRRANEKPPQKRRPGAASRNHEIYRSVMEKVRPYIDPSNTESFIFRQTRSGTIYGQFVEKDQQPSTDIIQNNDEEVKECELLNT